MIVGRFEKASLGSVRLGAERASETRRSRRGWEIALCLTLTACTTTQPPAPTIKVCPAIKTYSLAEQQAVSTELKALPKGDPLASWIVDYASLRAQVRACEAAR